MLDKAYGLLTGPQSSRSKEGCGLGSSWPRWKKPGDIRLCHLGPEKPRSKCSDHGVPSFTQNPERSRGCGEDGDPQGSSEQLSTGTFCVKVKGRVWLGSS